MGNDRGPAAGGRLSIATGAGLTGVGMPARILLILTGLSTLGIAATPEPATGPTSRHLAFAVSCVVTTAVWPVFVARRAPARSWILGVYGCATMTVVFAGLSCWLLIAARDGGGDLGLVERLTSAVQSLFPFVVALALRQTARDTGNQRQRGHERFQGTGRQLPRQTEGQLLTAGPDCLNRQARRGHPAGGRWSSAHSRPGTRNWTRRPDWFRRGDGRECVCVPAGGTGPAQGIRHNGLVDADVVVIGAGALGLSTALHCAMAGRSVAVMERRTAGSQASGRAAGLFKSVQADELRTRLAWRSIAKAITFADWAWDAPASSRTGEFPDRPDRPASPVPAPGTGTVTTLGR